MHSPGVDAAPLVGPRHDRPDRQEHPLPEAPPPAPARLHEWFERAARLHPDRPAIIDGPRSFTYAESDRRANQLACHLRGLGVGRGAAVGICLERSAEVYFALLAVLKAGAAYVPLDPDYPHDRVVGILDDSEAKVLITAPELAGKATGWAGCVLLPDAEAAAIARHSAGSLSVAETDVAPTDLAYIIYTSGSTGRPKGVMVEHRSAAHLVGVEREVYGMTPNDRVFQGFSVAFDASVEEVWMAFAAGAALVVGSREMMQSGPDLSRILTELGVTAFSTVPTLLAMLDGDLPTVRVLILGGEVCPRELVGRWCRPGRRLFNTYGPTEATVIATAVECAPGKPVTIGKPIPGYSVLILDEYAEPVPPGKPGELYIGGVGVARGYVGRADLTAERFFPNPFRPGERLYRTGDLGRWTAGGEIEFLGRVDSQVKIRGFRVELAEIEAVMLEVPGVRAAVAAVHAGPDGVQRLVGYVIPRGVLPVPEEELRAHLRARLPAYMVPGVIEALAEFPTLPSGKTDRKRLPPPRHHGDTATAEPRIGPRTPLEARLAAEWRALFDREVSVTDDFFLDLGGHSLLAARLVSALRADPALGHAAVPDVYHQPTIERLAAHLGRPRADVPTATQASPLAHPVPRLRHFVCGLGQLLALYVVLGFASLQWLGPFLVYAGMVDAGWDVLPALAAAMLSLLAVYPVMLALGLAVKWVVIGRFRAGRYPLWGWYFYRWWFVRAVLSVAPTSYLVGTPLLGLYYRLLGARIGRNVHFGTDEVYCFDLLTVGDDTCVNSDVGLHGYTVENGELVLGPITVGAGCTVGNRALLQPGATMHDGALLGDLSLLRGRQTIPAGERWSGSPARPEAVPPLAHAQGSPRPSLGSRFAHAVLYALASAALPLTAILAFLPGVIGLNWLSHHTPGFTYLLAAPLVAVSFVVLFALEVAAVKWVLLGRLRAGWYPRHGLFHLRWWFVAQLMRLSLNYTGTLYATIYLNPWYRLLGVRVGRRAEVSTASDIPFDLLELGAESFVADAVSLGAPRVEGDSLEIRPVRLGAKAFAGNGAHVPPGGELGADGLLGCQSVLPVEAAAPGTAWVGSPAFRLPQRQASGAFPEETISKPPLRLWLLRGLIEFVRVTLPATGLVLITSFLITTALALESESSLPVVLALFPLVYAAGAAAAALFVVLLKWVVIGRYRPTERPLWSGFVWRTELVTGVREHLADLLLVSLLKGTPFAPWYFRLLGARIGRRVFLDTTDLCEYDLTAVGDGAAVNQDATLQTHLFEDRVMKVDAVEIGAGAAVGAWTLVLYDTRIGPGTVVEDLSLVMKGEVLPPDTRWSGIPASRPE